MRDLLPRPPSPPSRWARYATVVGPVAAAMFCVVIAVLSVPAHLPVVLVAGLFCGVVFGGAAVMQWRAVAGRGLWAASTMAEGFTLAGIVWAVCALGIGIISVAAAMLDPVEAAWGPAPTAGCSIVMAAYAFWCGWIMRRWAAVLRQQAPSRFVCAGCGCDLPLAPDGAGRLAARCPGCGLAIKPPAGPDDGAVGSIDLSGPISDSSRIVRRARRWGFRCAIGLSLLLCVGMAALWGRSYFVQDDILFARPPDRRRAFVIRTLPGTLDLATVHRLAPVADRPRWMTRTVDADVRERRHRWEQTHLTAGFGYERIEARPPYAAHQTDLYLPMWIVCAVLAVLPGCWLGTATRPARRRWRAKRGCCPVCGRDLRASPGDAGPWLARCPKCGTAVMGRTSSVEGTCDLRGTLERCPECGAAALSGPRAQLR